jgi:hypothetical protein
MARTPGCHPGCRMQSHRVNDNYCAPCNKLIQEREKLVTCTCGSIKPHGWSQCLICSAQTQLSAMDYDE